ncbi:hypothetical protein E2C01_034452 [Portunus trituberculatus]|uniref:Uncharacterized protein n=1 Tax=Portunus trituberculatus TaxID=210409 RepID=A0A5B7F702_PORTR|nr:hypothetical protein [Portunus trituberculatus]
MSAGSGGGGGFGLRNPIPCLIPTFSSAIYIPSLATVPHSYSIPSLLLTLSSCLESSQIFHVNIRQPESFKRVSTPVINVEASLGLPKAYLRLQIPQVVLRNKA